MGEWSDGSTHGPIDWLLPVSCQVVVGCEVQLVLGPMESVYQLSKSVDPIS